ncbi:hypothetical protein EC957_002911 [Mortierella hygrophila]|uniref:Uncharacterized protein n=1 Tax=Mortierella hygrophila TaxID=979708 RepID=A0A9P6F2U5_9FUNG|nr:hypothetical protein EC957_002911 [Mortierella hygrophila]
MAQEDNAPPLISNVAVHKFYSRLQTRRSQSSTTESFDSKPGTTSAVDLPLPEALDSRTTTIDNEKLDQESSLSLKNTATEPQTATPVSDHQAPRETTQQDLPTNNNINKKSSQPARCTKTKNKADTKAIPRKEFRAIKKKLRKRELRRQNAVEICRIRALEAAQKPM